MLSKAIRVLATLVLFGLPVASQCDKYNASVDIGQNETGVFLQDRIGCAMMNLMAPGSLDGVVILFGILVIMMIGYAFLRGRR